MALTTLLACRVRNTSLPLRHALLPLLEAIVNSIQAIDARAGEPDDPGRIDVRMHELRRPDQRRDRTQPGVLRQIGSAHLIVRDLVRARAS